MIKNVPSPDDLLRASMRLYFTAWTAVVTVIEELGEAGELAYAGGEYIHIRPEGDEKIDEFLERSQGDLQLAYSLIQQSQELALKAKLCEVSPFLLLLGSDVRSWAKDAVDFTELRTIDASDLLKVADTVLSLKLPQNFKEQYQAVRGGRNKIQHLGMHSAKLDPYMLLDIMLNQHKVLFRDRKWLNDRLEHQKSVRYAVFYDNHWNEVAALLHELHILGVVLRGESFELVFGFKKGRRRYLCVKCRDEAADLDPKGFTAILVDDGKALSCILCGHKENVRRSRCQVPQCESNVLTDDRERLCLKCENVNGRRY